MEIKIPVYKPCLNGNELKYVTDCITSTWISSKGTYIKKFEEGFASYIGASHAISVSNGTVALHLAFLALEIGSGDEVIVPSLTYVASVNSIIYVGAKPVFVDVDAATWQMSIDDVRSKITSKTKAILAVHLYGNACNMDELEKICKEKGIHLVEDCAEALGTTYQKKSTGNFGIISTFSFFGNKTITTGEGGMVVTSDENLANKIFKLKTQGLTQAGDYWHDCIGYNYRMTNICAAIGVAQLEQIDEFLSKKRKNAALYLEHLKTENIEVQQTEKNVEHSFWMFSVLFENNALRNKTSALLRENGIETRPVFHAAHKMPMYGQTDLHLPIAEQIAQRGLNLPSYPDLQDSEIETITQLIKTCI